jgi:2-polyprenyl-3-methyl-5-hydroxy-6-metoxy-1,4-benzoquinol methylase
MKLSQDAMQLHINMLNDRTRTASYLKAIDAVVRPDDVVLDIGTGTGILAMAAARAGAGHVYAIEGRRQVGNVADAVIKKNGLSDRITLIKGWSTEVELPERADVLVSEVIGHDPLAEGALDTTADAVRRLLKPRARLVPNRLKIFCLPAAVPGAELKKLVFTHAAARDWRSWYGMEFDSVLDVNQGQLFRFLLNPYHLRAWKPLSEPVLLVDIDFKECPVSQIECHRTGRATSAGRMGGLIFYFELTLGGGVSLCSHPALVKKHHHWNSSVWVFTNPLPLEQGARFGVNYTYDPTNHNSWCDVSLVD